jgi:hypothetical protein
VLLVLHGIREVGAVRHVNRHTKIWQANNSSGAHQTNPETSSSIISARTGVSPAVPRIQAQASGKKKRNKSIRMQLLEGFAHECTTTNSNGGGASSIHVPSPCLYKQVESGLQRTEKNIRRQAAATPSQARTSGQQTEASVTRPFASAKQHPRKDNGCRIRRRLPPHEHPSW